jgi:hypothetical protein
MKAPQKDPPFIMSLAADKGGSLNRPSYCAPLANGEINLPSELASWFSPLTILERDHPSFAISIPADLNWRSVVGELAGLPVQLQQASSEQLEYVRLQERPEQLLVIDYRLQLIASQNNAAQTDLHFLLGPGLLLPLARLNVYAFHASAITLPNGAAVLFFGRSETGKSTVAAAANGYRGCVRCTDDISLIQLIDGKPCLLPYFPQLKLAPEQRYSGPAQIPIQHLIWLQRGAQAHSQLLPATSAITKLSAFAVASRLLIDQTLGAHFAFCGQLAQLQRHYSTLMQIHTLVERPANPTSAAHDFLDTLL